MGTTLTLDIIKSYGFEHRTYKPDWDDTCIDFTLPNGLVLTTMTQCNNEPTDSDSLEGMSGYIYIKTKEELDELLNKTYQQILEELDEKNEDFDINEFYL